MIVQSGVFVLQGDDTLVPMQPARFAAELDFQAMLSKFPSLLAGDQISPENPRRFLLVRQELAIGHAEDEARWSLDHLFLDQDGVPTLVEVKRQSDSRLRREVVGQMLDYAANLKTFYSMEKIAASFEAACQQVGADSGALLNEFLDSYTSSEVFWDKVGANISTGKMRLLFVADHIPSELRSIVEFLNNQMSPAEVLALELRQFAGQGLRTIVPLIFGQTQETAIRKEVAKGEKWTEERFREAAESRLAPDEATAAKAILEWMKSTDIPLKFGTGKVEGSVYLQLKPEGVPINPAYLSTDGKVWLQFDSLANKPVFGDLERRRELLRRFASVANSGLGEADLTRYANLPLVKVAADPRGVEKVVSALTWMVDQVRRVAAESHPPAQ